MFYCIQNTGVDAVVYSCFIPYWDMYLTGGLTFNQNDCFGTWKSREIHDALDIRKRVVGNEFVTNVLRVWRRHGMISRTFYFLLILLVKVTGRVTFVCLRGDPCKIRHSLCLVCVQFSPPCIRDKINQAPRETWLRTICRGMSQGFCQRSTRRPPGGPWNQKCPKTQ